MEKKEGDFARQEEAACFVKIGHLQTWERAHQHLFPYGDHTTLVTTLP